jgi:hypothetical protein
MRDIPPDPAAADRRAARIALSMAVALAWAETMPEAGQLSFLAPLCAAAIAAGPRVPPAGLAVLPLLGWALSIAAGLAVQAFSGMPLAMAALQFAMFRIGFSAAQDPRLAVPSVLLLITFSVLPIVLIRVPALAGDVALWLGTNVAVAVVTVLVVRWLLPDRPASGAAHSSGPPLRRAPIAPGIAAGALLLAVFLAALMQPPAIGAFLISVVLSLRAEVTAPGRVMRDRFGAAFIGGAAAWVGFEIVGFANSLPVLFATTLLLAWVMARRSAAGGEDATMWLKALNAYAILLGEGFSLLFENTDARLGIRIAGVTFGLAYGIVVLWLFGKPAPHAPGGLSASSAATAAASLGARPLGGESAARSSA